MKILNAKKLCKFDFLSFDFFFFRPNKSQWKIKWILVEVISCKSFFKYYGEIVCRNCSDPKTSQTEETKQNARKKSSLMRKVSLSPNKFELHKNVNLIVFTPFFFGFGESSEFDFIDKKASSGSNSFSLNFVEKLKKCYCITPKPIFVSVKTKVSCFWTTWMKWNLIVLGWILSLKLCFWG